MLAPTLVLVAACAIWGSTFVLVKDAVVGFSPLMFLAIRFSLGAAAVAAASPGSVRAARRIGWRPILVVGTALAAGYAFQTIGLVYTSATNAGFITGLFVVFTPALGALVLRRIPDRFAIAGVLLATTGLTLLSLRIVAGRPPFSGGDGLILACAVAFAVHILMLERYAPRSDVRGLVLGQLAVAAVLFWIASVPSGLELPRTRQVWVALAVTAFGATAFGFWAQTWAQARLSATRTAVMLTMEPVFAGLFAYLWADERLTVRGWAGAGLIVAGMLAAEVGAKAPVRRLAPETQRG